MRLVIAGVTSGVGKTTIATGLIGAFRQRGLRVQPFKAGPDYIDPSYHGLAAGVPSRNLDCWMLGSTALLELYQRSAGWADIAVIEGVMGLYDGRSGLDEAGSTAQVAKLLDAPALLVVDVSKMARSAGAIVLGYQSFDPELRLAGVILNNVGSDTHRRWVTEAIEQATNLPVLGAMPRKVDVALPERHLGLIPTGEGPTDEAFLDRLIAMVKDSVDLPAILEVAKQTPSLAPIPAALFPPRALAPRARLAVAMDEAFSFYYQDNLDLLVAWGAQLVPFSPLRDSSLPAGIGGLYIGGGFPEVYATGLATNRPMLEAVRGAVRDGLPTYAECGGLMYLTAGIVDGEGERHKMVGAFPVWSTMQRRHVVLGYATVRARQSSFLLEAGESVRAHEFHWSELESPLDSSPAYDVLEQSGRVEGYQRDNLLASYFHIHFGAHGDLAPRFVEACSRRQS